MCPALNSAHEKIRQFCIKQYMRNSHVVLLRPTTSFLLCFLITHIACFCSLDPTWVLVYLISVVSNIPTFAETVETKLDFKIVCQNTKMVHSFSIFFHRYSVRSLFDFPCHLEGYSLGISSGISLVCANRIFCTR